MSLLPWRPYQLQLLERKGLASDERFSFGADLPDEAVNEASAFLNVPITDPQKVQGRARCAQPLSVSRQCRAFGRKKSTAIHPLR